MGDIEGDPEDEPETLGLVVIEGDPEDEPEIVGLGELDTVEEPDTLSETVPEAECEFVPLLELLTVTEVLFDSSAVCDVDDEPEGDNVADPECEVVVQADVEADTD